jgi:rubrerythrin
VVFANKDDGQTYLAASMIQLFRKTDDEIYRSGECPFCAEIMVDQGEWSTCPICKRAWADGNRFRKDPA